MAGDYKIKFTTEADTAGAEKTAEELKNVGAAADVAKAKLAQATQTNRTLTAEQSQVSKSAAESAAAFQELLPPVGKAAEATKELSGQRRFSRKPSRS